MTSNLILSICNVDSGENGGDRARRAVGPVRAGAQHDAAQVVLRPVLRDDGVQLRLRPLLGARHRAL